MFVLSFILPKIYEMRKHDIDSAVSQGYNSSQRGYNQYLKPYVEKIPRASTSARSSGTTSGTTGPTAAGESHPAGQDTPVSSQPCAGCNEAQPHACSLPDAGHSVQSCLAQATYCPSHSPDCCTSLPPSLSTDDRPHLAGRNAGLTSDTASSDQYGTGRGSGGPTMGEQAQGGAQRMKESAQDFANPSSGQPAAGPGSPAAHLPSSTSAASRLRGQVPATRCTHASALSTSLCASFAQLQADAKPGLPRDPTCVPAQD